MRRGGAKTIRLIRNQEKMSRRKIAHAVVLTRTSAAITSRALRNVSEQLQAGGIEIFATAIVERAAYPRSLRLWRHPYDPEPVADEQLGQGCSECSGVRRGGGLQA